MKMKVDLLEEELKQERQSAKLLYDYIPQKVEDEGDGDVLRDMGKIQREVDKILNEDKIRAEIATSPIRELAGPQTSPIRALADSTSRQTSPVRLHTSPSRVQTSPVGVQTEYEDKEEIDDKYLRTLSRSYSFSEQSDIISTQVSEKLDSALAKSRKGKVLPVWKNVAPREKVVKPELKSLKKRVKMHTPSPRAQSAIRPALRSEKRDMPFIVGKSTASMKAEKRDMPFIVGKSTGKSYSVTANIRLS
jgi:hypothetical protein